jgi:hypothetical protein
MVGFLPATTGGFEMIRAAILLATATVAMQGCTTEGGEVGTNPTPKIPSISISIDVTSATVAAGESVAIGAKLTGRGGFTGAGASFDLTGAPAGITFAVSNLQTSGSVTTATITVSVAATVPRDTYTLTLIGSGAGVSPVSALVTLTVPIPAITLSIDPPSVTVAQGQSVAFGARLIGSGGFMGAGAAFALTGAPTGITSAISDLQIGGYTTATITLSAAAHVPPGTYTLDLTGSGTGVSPVSVSFALTVLNVGFTLSVNPAALDTCEGCDDVTATITISRISGFTGSVLLSVSSSAVGQGGSFTTVLNPTSTAGNSSILTLSTSAPPGNYTLTITGTAPGFVTQTVTIAVTVW